MAGDLTVWDAIPLDELTEEETPITYGVVKPGKEGEVPFVRGGDIAGGRVLMDQLRTIGRDVSQQYRRTLLRGGEILVSLVGNPGQIAIAPPSLAGANIARQVGLVRLKPEIDTRFVSYFLQSHDGQTALGAQSLGSVQQVINLRDLKTVKIPLPPLAEQKAIAAVLGALDDKIELNRRMNATLEAMARALFQSWFVDFDPVRAKLDGRKPIGLDETTAALFPEHLKDSLLGHIPKGWEVKTVGDIGDVICGKTPPTSVADYYGEDIPFITIPDMHGNVFGAATGRKLSHAGANSQANKTLPPGSLCVSCIATPGLVVITSEDSQTNQQINSVVPHQKEETYFWYWVMTSLRAEIASSGSGGSVLVNLSKGRFETLHVIKPPHALIRAYHTTVRPLFEAILANTHQSRTLATLRDTLLPKLLSGELSPKLVSQTTEGLAAR